MKESHPTEWVPVWIAACTSLLVLLACVVLLAMKWYRMRTIWSWFQLQLSLSLVPISSFYVSSPQNTVITFIYVNQHQTR